LVRCGANRNPIVTQVTVRPGHVDDLPRLTEIYNHYVEHTHVTFDLKPFTVEARREWFSHYSDTGRHRMLVAERDGVVIGYATSGPWRDKAAYARSVETTVYLAPAAVGSGAGSALYVALFDALADAHVHRALAGIALPNDASIALHRKFGFTDVGTFREVGHKFGKWWDVLWLQLAVSNRQAGAAATRFVSTGRTTPPATR
jgi:phosphinothricin acetyltransferase